MSAPCIVLAGGLGTRLRSVLPDLPKCLAPVHGRPFLEWQLHSLAQRGVDRFVLALGHGADHVMAALDPWRATLRIDCVVEPEALGTGGAIRHALLGTGLEEALVVNGDTFLGGDLAGMLAPLDGRHGELVRMAVVEVPDRHRFGGVAVTESCVTHFIEKGQMGPGLINAGLYRVSLKAFGDEQQHAFSFETAVLPRLARAQQLWASAVAGPFIDIGIPEDYQLFCERHEHFLSPR